MTPEQREQIAQAVARIDKAKSLALRIHPITNISIVQLLNEARGKLVVLYDEARPADQLSTKELTDMLDKEASE